MMRCFEDLGSNEAIDEVGDIHIKQPQRLVDGINLTDLMNGKEAVFKINNEYNEFLEDFVSDDEIDENDDADSKMTNSSGTLRSMRGAPVPGSTFGSIAASMIDVDNDGYVKKEIIMQGTGSPPPDNSRVIIHYNFYKEGNEEPFDSSYLRGRPLKLCLDKGEVIPGLEIAIKSMKKNENSRFFIKWEAAFGRQGCPPRIGKECDILADVTLINYKEMTENFDTNGLTKEEIFKFDFHESMNEAKNLHSLGSEDFLAENFKGAIKNYRKSLGVLNQMKMADEEEETRVQALKVKCLVNLAICYNKIGRSESACLVCRDALSIQPNNVKAFFQYGKANLHLSNFELAEKWLKKAKKMKPEDEDINKELMKLQNKKETAQIEDVLFCQRVFGKLSSSGK